MGNIMKTTTKILICMVAAAVMAACGNRKTTPENSMVYRSLGNTGLTASEIGLGCGGFGEMTKEEARAFMDVAIDSGVNYIDLYDANPVVRDNIGYAIQGRRDKMQIQGHIGTCWVDGQYKRTRDVEESKQGFEDMLQRLGTDYIEVGMIHITDTPEQWQELEESPFMEYVQQLKNEGRIKHIGVSSHNAQVALMAAKSGKVEVIMFSMNPAFDRLQAGANVWDPKSYETMLAGIDPVRVELFDYCAQNGIAITVMKAFGGGGKLLQAETSPLKVALTPVQCISYSLAKPCVASVLCGAGNIDELKADLHYLHATDAEKEYMSVLAVSNVQSVSFGDCTYCSHCAPCPQGINIAKVNKCLDRAVAEGKVSPELQQEYDAMEHHASDCVECGACESRCPFDVSIRQRMKEAVKVFGK